MTIQEQTEVSPVVRRDRSEWSANPLRPVARWVMVPGDNGSAGLEMVWHVPDPQAADIV